MNAASARVPELGKLRTELEKLNRPPTAIDKAIAASLQLQEFPVPNAAECEGDLHIGVFFDGTNNNKEVDYGPEDNPKPFLERSHTNVVRLYNVFPDEGLPARQKSKSDDDKNQFYRIYVPGVGTKFKEIGDSGEGWESDLGGGTGFGGEARLLWAMMQVLNAVHKFYFGPRSTLISDSEALSQIEGISISGTMKKALIRSLPGVTAYDMVFGNKDLSRKLLKDWVKTRLVLPDRKPRLRNIYIYPFGFSRGAAEARTFCNWMIELLETTPGKLSIQDRPVSFPFLGIYDTVASVGIAGLWSISEGHMGWGHKTQQISRHIRSCVHMVAAHEVRACFPLDTVRVDGAYPGNCQEIVYPGVHSDVGGGYEFRSIGKDDVDTSSGADRGEMSSGDLQISRLPGFDMYLLAREAGVPFYTIGQLKAQGRAEIAKDLLPDTRTIDAMQAYLDKANIGALAVEEQLRRHTSLYFYWRWRLGSLIYSPEQERLQASARQYKGEEIKKLKDELSSLNTKVRLERLKHPYGKEPSRPRAQQVRAELAELQKIHNPASEVSVKELAGLKRTQAELMAVIAGYCNEIDRRVAELPKSRESGPLQSPNGRLYEAKVASAAVTKAATTIVAGPAGMIVSRLYKTDAKTAEARRKDLENLTVFSRNCIIAEGALGKRNLWRSALKNANLPEEHDSGAPEREAMWLLDGLALGDVYHYDCHEVFGKFFSDHVHDSMAGFPVEEFPWNGYGIAKFRRLFYGDNADRFARDKVEERNKACKAAAKSLKAG